MATDRALTRSPDDRLVYVLEGVGELRLGGWRTRAATASADGRTWTFVPRGIFHRKVEALDAAEVLVGCFAAQGMRRGGEISWGGRELHLRPASRWAERYALADGARELALLDAKGWGRRPVRVTVEDVGAIEPALLLFGAFLVHRLAEDAGAAGTAAAGGAAAVAGS